MKMTFKNQLDVGIWYILNSYLLVSVNSRKETDLFFLYIFTWIMHLIVFLWSLVIISCLMLAFVFMWTAWELGEDRQKGVFVMLSMHDKVSYSRVDILHLRARDLSHFPFSKKKWMGKNLKILIWEKAKELWRGWQASSLAVQVQNSLHLPFISLKSVFFMCFCLLLPSKGVCLK